MAYHKCASIYGTNNSTASVQTASGAIANFNTKLAMPLKSLKVDFNATQEEGTPTPQSPKAISGVSEVNVVSRGLNLWNEQWELGGFAFANGSLTPSTDRIRNKIPIKVKPNAQYFAVAPARFAVGYYDKNGNYLGYQDNKDNTIFTTKPDTDHIYFFCVVTSYGNNISINADTSDTEYHAYNGTTQTINLGGTYYGGYVEQDKDGHRKIILTYYELDMGELNYDAYVYGGVQGFYASLANITQKPKPSANVICSIYSKATTDDLFNNDGIDYEMFINSGRMFKVKNSDYSDKNTFKSAMSGIKIYYELETPIEIDLPNGTPIKTLPGVNNIYADTGDTEVAFKKLA